MKARTLSLTLFLTWFAVVMAPPAHAYVGFDASALFQILIGGLLGAVAAVAAFWRRIVGFFTRRRAREKVD